MSDEVVANGFIALAGIIVGLMLRRGLMHGVAPMPLGSLTNLDRLMFGSVAPPLQTRADRLGTAICFSGAGIVISLLGLRWMGLIGSGQAPRLGAAVLLTSVVVAIIARAVVIVRNRKAPGSL